jgi:hypothetical protein
MILLAILTEPREPEPLKAEPLKAEPLKAEPLKAEPLKAEPLKNGPGPVPDASARRVDFRAGRYERRAENLIPAFHPSTR